MKKNRLTSKTPKFFRIIRNIGIGIGLLGTAIVTAPVSLPAILITAAPYLIWAGSIAGTVAQLTKEDKDDTK